jgi:predicted peroxiredoxin
MSLTEKQVLIVATSSTETSERYNVPFFFAQQAAGKGAKVRICFIL